MPPAAEPILWQVLDRVRSTLAGIAAGSNYWQTPHAVYVVSSFENDERLYDSSLGDLAGGDPATIYAVRRFDRNTLRLESGDATSGDRPRATVEIGVLVSQQHVPSAATDTPTGAQVLERLCADVLRALMFADPGLGSGVVANDVAWESGVDDTITIDAPEGWIAAGLIFRVAYSFFSSRP